MKLIEGEIHHFKVLKKTTVPDEGVFFLLRHSAGRRILIPEKYYVNYNILPGSTIKCRIDKVSCTGKIFLEPKHPVYQEGETYMFDILDYEPAINNENSWNIRVSDVFSNVIKAHCRCVNPILKERIELVVNRIRKGIPEVYYLEEADFKVNEEHIERSFDF